jgi:hypothetical protein
VERYEIVVVRDGQERVVGSYAVTLDAIDGRLLVTQETRMGQAVIIDTAWVDPATFVPFRQVSYGPTGRSELRFNGARVTGARTQPDSTRVAVDEPLPQAAFSGSLAQLMLRALPLAADFHVTFPVFRDPGGLSQGTARVAGRENVAGSGRSAWKVTLALGAQVATVWIDEQTGVDLRTEAIGPGGSMLVMRRVGPAPAGPRPSDPVVRIREQDPSLDNLVLPPGAPTASPGSLGAVRKHGTGRGAMVLIPGLGFGGRVFDRLMEAFADSFTMWAVTLPGFDGTAPPPMPAPGTSYGVRTWTAGAQHAIEELIVREGLRNVVVVGHWLIGTQVALGLRESLPDRIRAIVLLSGSARFASARAMTTEQRVAFVDGPFSQGWFKTVTRETWDDNNFLPSDYAAHPVVGLRLWRQAANASLPTWIRYLLEYHARDITQDLRRSRVPTLLLHPGLEGAWREPAGDYLAAFTSAGWGDLAGSGIEVRTIPGARVVMWADQLDRVVDEMQRFIATTGRG